MDYIYDAFFFWEFDSQCMLSVYKISVNTEPKMELHGKQSFFPKQLLMKPQKGNMHYCFDSHEMIHIGYIDYPNVCDKPGYFWMNCNTGQFLYANIYQCFLFLLYSETSRCSRQMTAVNSQRRNNTWIIGKSSKTNDMTCKSLEQNHIKILLQNIQ